MTQTKIYKISWYDSTNAKRLPEIFNHYKIIKKQHGKTDVLAWDFFDAKPEALKEAVVKWLTKNPRGIANFVVTKKFNKRILLTRRDLQPNS